MAQIFVAAEEQTLADLRRILGKAHEIESAASLSSAVAQLKENDFDLIVVGVLFDESRMFELLPQIKDGPNIDTPIICLATVDTPMTRTMSQTIEMACKFFGAWMYLDRQKFTEAENPDDQMARLIDRCLNNEARKSDLAQRIDIQSQREKIMQQREALEAEEWSPPLEDKLGKIKRKVSKLMLALSDLRIEHVEQKELLAISKGLADIVPERVNKSEAQLEHDETRQELREFSQTRKENAIVEGEEIRSEAGRRDQHLRSRGKSDNLQKSGNSQRQLEARKTELQRGSLRP